MAYMQRTRVLTDSDLDDDATWRRRIDLTGKVAALELRINCDRYATRAAGTEVHTLLDCISRIELLKDATSPLISLTGEQIDAMNYWDFKKPNPRRYRQEASTGNDIILFLMGGRSLYDRRYGFDFDRLSKVYLEYTYDLNEGVNEYFKADDHDIKIYEWKWVGNDAPNFQGYLRTRQLDAWTTTASGAEHLVDIPASNPIRRVCVQAKTASTTLGGTLSKLELRVDKGAYSPVIIPSLMDWTMAEVVEYGLDNAIGGIDYQIAVTVGRLPYWFSYYDKITLTPYASDMEDLHVFGLITLPPRTLQITSEAGEFVFDMSGWGFQKCLRIGFDHEEDGFDLLRVPVGKALDLVCTENAASKSVAAFVQDVISY